MATKITERVDVEIQQGNVEVNGFIKALQTTLEQRLARLPGITSIIAPDIKLDKSFNPDKVLKELEKKLGDKEFAASVGEKGFKKLEQQLAKYKKAIEDLNNVKVNVKNFEGLQTTLQGLTSGKLQFQSLKPDLQRRVQEFREYVGALIDVWRQVNRGFVGLNSYVTNPEYIREVQKPQALLKRAKTDLKKAQIQYDNAVKNSLDTTKAAKRVEILSNRVTEREAAISAVAEHIPKTINAGALIDPVSASFTQNLLDTQKKLHGLVKDIPPGIIVKEDRAKSNLDTYLKSVGRENRDMAGLSPQTLANITGYVRDERAATKQRYAQQGMDYAGTQDQKAHDALLKAINDEKSRQLMLAREATENYRAALRSQRQLTVLEQQQLNAVERGNKVRQSFPDVRSTPLEMIPDRRVALRAEIARQETIRSNADTASRAPGLNTDQIKAYGKASREATGHIYRLGQEMHALGAMAEHTHPIIERVGRLLNRFAQYGIGYAALYQVTQGFKNLLNEVISFEDKLKTIQAVTGSTNADITSMASNIKKVSETTGFDIGQITDAVKVLAQAGVSLKEMPNTLRSVVDVATATGTTLTTAADVITTAKEIWDSVNVTTIGDRITQAANVSKLAVEDLQTIFNLQASAAKAANLSLDQNLALIATLRNKGYKESTIATGTTQMFAELFSPDKKFSQFLSQQYASVGEKVTEKEAAQKFANFRNADDPVLRALQELVRIGVRNTEAQVRLERAIDRRSLRVLRPSLDAIVDLPATQARLTSAPTSTEAAKVAMDSLKKSLGNLSDATTALTDTVVRDGGVLEALQNFTKGLTAGVHGIDAAVKEAQKNGINVISEGTAAGLVAAIASKLSGKGIFKSLLTGVGMGTTVGSLEASGNSLEEKAGDALTAGASAKLSYDMIKGLVKRGTAKEVFMSGASRFGTMAMSAVTVGQTIGIALVSYLAASKIGQLLSGDKDWSPDDLFSSGDKKKEATRPTSDTLLRELADQKAAFQAQFDTYKPYLPLEKGQTASKDTFEGALALINRDTQSVVDRFSGLTGAKISAAQTGELLKGLQTLSGNLDKTNPSYQKSLTEIVEKFGVKGKALSPEDALDLGGMSTSILASRQGMLERIKGLRSTLGAGQLVEGSFEAKQYEALKKLSIRPEFDKTFFGNTSDMSFSQTDTVMRDFTSVMADLTKGYPSKTELDHGQMRKLVVGALHATTDEEFRKLVDVLLENIRDLANTLGDKAANDLQQELSGVMQGVSKRSTSDVTRERIDKLSGLVNNATSGTLGERNQSDQTDLQRLTETLQVHIGVLKGAAERKPEDTQLLQQAEEALKASMGDTLQGDYKHIADQLMNGIYAAESRGTKNPYEALGAPVTHKVNGKEITEQARGKFQILPSTAADPGRGVKPLVSWEPQEQYRFARDHLAALLAENNGDLDKTLKAYSGNKTKPEELKAYKRKVLSAVGMPTELDKLQQGGWATRTEEGKWDLGYRGEQLKKRADSYVKPQETPEVKDYVQSDAAFNRSVDLERLDDEIKKLSNSPKAWELGVNTTDNLFNKRRDKTIANLQEERAFQAQQPYPDETHKQRLIQQIDLKIEKATLEAADAIATASREVTAKAAQIQLKIIDSKIQEASITRENVAKAGLTPEFNAVQEQINKLLIEREKQEQIIAENTKVGADLTAEQNDIINRKNRSIQEQLGFDQRMKLLQGREDRAAKEPAVFAQLQAQGSHVPIGMVKDYLAGRLTTTQQSLSELTTAKLANQAEQQKAPADTALKAEATRIDAEIEQRQRVIAQLTQDLKDFDSTLLGEIKQISASSIAAQIQDLPSSMKHLNKALEEDVVTAVDNFGTVIADSAIKAGSHLLGFGYTAEQVQQKLAVMSELWAAQGNKAQVMMDGVNVAEQINQIKLNELDPARQEYLISQAMQGQQTAVNAAQNQIDAAQYNVDKYNRENSFMGKAGTVATDFLRSGATDVLKSMSNSAFGALFGFMGKPDGTESNPINVKVVNGPTDTGVRSGESPSLLSGIGSTISGAWNAVTGWFGSSDTTNATNPQGDLKDTVSTGIKDGLSSDWYSGLTESMNNSNQGLLSGIGSTFDQFTSRLGVIFNAKNAWETSTVSTIQKWVGIASSLVGVAGGISGAAGSSGAVSKAVQGSGLNTYAASGGYITGPGTGTSDSIPARLSNGEYVLNHKAVKAIGKSTLDAWNFNLSRPMHFATGGMVGAMSQAVNNRQAAPQSPAASQNSQDPKSLRVVLVDDQRNVADFISSPAGETSLVGFVKRNKLTLSSLLKS